MTDDLRAKLAAAIMELWQEEAGDLGDPATVPGAGDIALAYADALLPIVEAHGRASAATALRQAARDLYHGKAVIGLDTPDWLYDRADDLEARP